MGILASGLERLGKVARECVTVLQSPLSPLTRCRSRPGRRFGALVAHVPGTAYGSVPEVWFRLAKINLNQGFTAIYNKIQKNLFSPLAIMDALFIYRKNPRKPTDRREAASVG